ATKRALATFGNVFGLALYDPAQGGVKQSAKVQSPEPLAKGPWVLQAANGAEIGRYARPAPFIAALRKAMAEARDIESLFAVWENNVSTIRAFNAAREKLGLQQGFAQDLVAYLKSCAVALVKPKG